MEFVGFKSSDNTGSFMVVSPETSLELLIDFMSHDKHSCLIDICKEVKCE